MKLNITSNNAKLIEIGEGAFFTCHNIESITLSDEIRIIRDYTFNNCHKLKLMNLGDKITCIGQEAFQFCEEFEEIYIPDNVEEIKKFAFSGCNKLDKISLSAGVKLGVNVFYKCKGTPTYREVYII